MTETQVQRKIRENLIREGWTVIRLTVTGVGGMPDLLALKDGEVPLFIECKKTGKLKLDPLQKYMQKQLISKGFRSIVADSLKKVYETLDKSSG